MLGPGVQARLQEKAGTVLEWWARLDHAGNPRAVVLGPLGLCKANPVSRNGKRAYLVERLQLEPGALRRRSFDGSRTPPGLPAPPTPRYGPPPRRPLSRSPARPRRPRVVFAPIGASRAPCGTLSRLLG